MNRSIILFQLVFGLILIALIKTSAQSADALRTAILEKDSLLFDRGFNECVLSEFEKNLSTDFEFYHDRNGHFNDRNQFIETVERNICGNPNQPQRKLDRSTVQIFPLYKRGELYGAIQNGTHRFYAGQGDRAGEQTGEALYSHLWILEDGDWKLSRVYSFDHK